VAVVLDLDELANAIGERAVLPALGHELRTPLTSIRGYIETLLDGEVDAPTARRFLETALRETLRLGRLIDGMLDRSPEGLAASKSVSRCDVVEQIRNTVEMIEPLARPRDVRIRTRLPERAIARIDGDLCVHALANLLENAVKHGCERGIVEISCRRVRARIETLVEDDGAGIESGAAQAVFAVGVRGRAAARGGSGIGLAVVRAIAERAGGDVRVERSSLGGARFVLRLPAG
jgi:two-component system, OmpR family, phosphate regulon sensor histidine kinase PhoR